MGPGFNRMNPVTIQQTTQGLLRYLQQQAPQQLAGNGVIIGGCFMSCSSSGWHAGSVGGASWRLHRLLCLWVDAAAAAAAAQVPAAADTIGPRRESRYHWSVF
jgi:hypothetical protein